MTGNGKTLFNCLNGSIITTAMAVLLCATLSTSVSYAGKNAFDSVQVLSNLSDKESAFLKGKQKISLCVKSTEMPLGNIDSQSRYQGILAELTKLIAKKINKHIITVRVSRDEEALEKLKQGTCDMFSTFKPSLKNGTFSFSQPFFQGNIAMAIANTQVRAEELKYLSGRHFAINKNTSFFNSLLEKYPQIQFIPVHNAKTGLAMVTAGRVYGYIDLLSTLAYQAKENGVIGIKTADFLDNNFYAYYALKQDQALLLSIINKAISSIREAEQKSVISLWTGIHYHPKALDYTAVIGGGGLFGFILLCGYLLCLQNNRKHLTLTNNFQVLSEQNQQLKADLDNKRNLEKQSIRFAEMFSHEYRTPVSIISTNLDILELKNEQTPMYIESQLEKMRDGVSKLIALVETALDREHLASTNLVAEKADLDFCLLINTVAGEMAVNYPKRKLIVQMTENSCMLFGDAKLLKVMLKNLIENSFKYSHLNQPVTVIVAVEDNQCLITVIDKGIGIPSADIKHIFDKYHRAVNTSNASGIGLGLYLTKLIVTQHQGHILVACPPEGGTQIKIELPR